MRVPRPRPAALAGLLGLLLVAGGLSAHWFWAAGQVTTAIARWSEEQRARGYDIAYGGPQVGGFPVALSLRLEAPSVASPRGWRWSGDRVLGRADVWSPLTLRLELPRQQELSGLWRGRARRLAVAAGDARGMVHIRRDGEVDTASVEMADLTLRDEAGWTARAETLRYDLTTRRPGPDGAPDPIVALSGEATGVGLPEAANAPFDDTLQRLAVAADVVGRVPSGDPAAALAAWRDRGGRVEVKGIELRWGPIEISARGTAVLDQALRPEGAFDAGIRGLPEAVDALEQRGMIEKGAAFALKMTAFALSRTQDGSGRPEVTLPITLRDGLVYLGPVALFSLGPVL